MFQYYKKGANEATKELQRENAELEGVLERTQKDLELVNDYKNDYIKKLEKAKDILRRLMESQPPHSDMCEEADLVSWREVNKEAEQFLKENA